MFVLIWVYLAKNVFRKKPPQLTCMFVSAFEVQSTDNILKYKRTFADESIATFHSLTCTSYLEYFHLVNSRRLKRVKKITENCYTFIVFYVTFHTERSISS